MDLKTFTIDKPRFANPPESKVWFHLEFKDGEVVYLEEHEGYAGGPISDGDCEKLFLRRVERRGGDVEAAKAFLEENR
jgi:hypothetical protein